MPKIRKIPYTDDVVLYGRSIGCVNIGPTQLAATLKVGCDHGHDDLDRFEILIVEGDGVSLAFYRHKGSPADFANVCPINGAGVDEVRRFLRISVPATSLVFEEYDELW
tara:strand:- start:1424 stop:1750 length:327 start_codon:yes stop_codon:yes gene_type:complete